MAVTCFILGGPIGLALSPFVFVVLLLIWLGVYACIDDSLQQWRYRRQDRQQARLRTQP